MRPVPRGSILRRLAHVIWALALPIAGCDETTGPPGPQTLTLDAELRQSLARWGVVPVGPMSAQSPARVELGRALFFDPILSGNRDISCATCHHPAEALGDGRSLPVGTGGSGRGATRVLGADRELVPRSSPSLLNSGLGMQYLFWDGRLALGHFTLAEAQDPIPFPAALTRTLEMQAVMPLLDRREMRGQPGDLDVLGSPNELAELADDRHVEIWRAVVERLLTVPAYVDLFNGAFPGTPPGAFGIEHVARTLAAFQKEAFTRTGSPFDRYLDRDDHALNGGQKRGALLFFGDAGCGGCHGGPFLGGQGFANVGVPQIGPGVGAELPLDLGRGEIFGDFYRFTFRVAPLRNVELTAPYMHNGAFGTLEDVVRHYDDVPASLRAYDPSHLDPAAGALHHGDDATVDAVLGTLDFRVSAPLEMSDADVADLVAFLEALTDPSARDLRHLVPEAVPSGLSVQR